MDQHEATKAPDDSSKSGTSSKKSWLLVILLCLSYGFGELSHFLVGVTSPLMAQELHYGDQGCMKNSSVHDAQEAKGTSCEAFNETSLAIKLNGTDVTPWEWNFNGFGIVYQVLAGPSFIFAFTIGGLVMGGLGDKYNRIIIIAVCTSLYSIFTVIMGFCNEVWQLILIRLAIALGVSSQPVSSSIVADIFHPEFHGITLGIVNFGIYVGYGLSYIVGNYIPAANILGEGWRWAYYISGVPGILVAVILLVTVKEPQRKPDREDQETSSKKETPFIQCWQYLQPFFNGKILLLCLASSIRHTAGFSWAYNSKMYYQTYYPEWDVGPWLFCSPIIAGSIGIFAGGALSDRITQRVGLQARAWVLASSQLLAAPCAAGVLLVSPPYSFVISFASDWFSEMWFGVLFAILVEVIPAEACSFTIGIFLFVMNNVGGNLPVLVDPLTAVVGYRGAILIMQSGCLFLSAILFGLCGLSLQKKVAC